MGRFPPDVVGPLLPEPEGVGMGNMLLMSGVLFIGLLEALALAFEVVSAVLDLLDFFDELM